VPLTNYYDLLGVPPTASQEEVKRAFRQQIARYHPDKVQHLGKEFQAMAANRAAELTEAYRVLSDGDRRAEYDNALPGAGSAAAAAPPPAEPQATETSPASPPASHRPESDVPKGPQFSRERASGDEFIRKATIGRFRQACTEMDADYEESQVRGFEIACVPKAKLFGRGKGPRLLVQFVSRVDGAAVAEAWSQAVKWGAPSKEEICVFLMGSSMAAQGELADAIAAQRRKTRGGKVALIPVDARNWDAHMPTDAPAVAKNLLARLRGAT